MKSAKKNIENNNESAVKTDDILQDHEEEIELMVDELSGLEPAKNIQFSINASNQASLNRTTKGPFSQSNALIVLINPYTLDNLNFSDIEVDIQMRGHDSVIIDGEKYKTHEIQPGISIFGIFKGNEGEAWWNVGFVLWMR